MEAFLILNEQDKELIMNQLEKCIKHLKSNEFTYGAKIWLELKLNKNN